VNAKDLVKLGGRLFDGREVAVIEHHGERKAPEVVSAEFDLLDTLAELSHLRFLGVIEEKILGRGVIQVDLANEGTLGVVIVPALGLNRAARRAGVLLLPFRHDVVIGADGEQPFQEQGEGVSGRLFES